MEKKKKNEKKKKMSCNFTDELIKSYFKVLLFNCAFSIVHILLIIEKTRSVVAFVPGRESEFFFFFK